MQSYDYIDNSFCGKASLDIYYQGWLAKNTKAIVVVVHGLGEHSGRYKNLVDQFKNKNVSIYGFDLRGHGKSGGKRGHVTSFIDYVYDLKLFINLIKEKNPELPIILLGHSLGGVIATRFALTYKNDIKLLVLSSPAFQTIKKVKGLKKTIVSFMGSFFPSFTFKNEIDPDDLSHDKNVVRNYINDDLNHDKISARLYFEYKYNSQYCLERAEEIRMPVLLLHGRGDKVADIKGSEKFIKRIKSRNKRLEAFDDLYHELMNEKKSEKDIVLKILLNRVLEVITGKSKKTKKSTTKKTAKKSTKKITKKVTKKKTSKKAGKKAVKKKTVKAKKAAKKTVKKKSIKKKR